MDTKLRSEISKSIEAVTGSVFEVQQVRACGGGCINEAVILCGEANNYFVKLNKVETLEMFVAESAALAAMQTAQAIRVPVPICYGSFGSFAYLVLEALEFGSGSDWMEMGRQLAKLHRHTTDRFGWERDNTIGSTPQRNTWSDSWTDFFCEQRLGFQFKLARQNGYRFDKSDTLLNRVADILVGHTPVPSLLHGDLWSGNAGFLISRQPVIYDPACYYGDRETDLAFSEFFGGFSTDFYRGYQSEWPLAEGYEQRKVLYNLYHVLNHANLFGGGYATQAQQMIDRVAFV